MNYKILPLCVLCFFLATGTLAYQTHSNTTNSFRPLEKIQRVRLAQSLVSQLMKNNFFQDLELPVRVSLSKLGVQGDSVPVTSTQLTNDILDELLTRAQVVVVNQDFDTQVASGYRLMSYLTDYETRQKGVLLGADYYIQGKLKYTLSPNEKGKMRPSYQAELFVRDIRTDALIAQATYEK